MTFLTFHSCVLFATTSLVISIIIVHSPYEIKKMHSSKVHVPLAIACCRVGLHFLLEDPLIVCFARSSKPITNIMVLLCDWLERELEVF